MRINISISRSTMLENETQKMKEIENERYDAQKRLLTKQIINNLMLYNLHYVHTQLH